MCDQRNSGGGLELAQPIIDDYGNVVGHTITTYEKTPVCKADNVELGITRGVNIWKTLS